MDVDEVMVISPTTTATPLWKTVLNQRGRTTSASLRIVGWRKAEFIMSSQVEYITLPVLLMRGARRRRRIGSNSIPEAILVMWLARESAGGGNGRLGYRVENWEKCFQNFQQAKFERVLEIYILDYLSGAYGVQN